jgi:hypothetical protein
LSSIAAAVALNAGQDAYEALELLELGRGVIAGLFLEMRIDISTLKQQYPILAEEFKTLRNELDLPTRRASLSTPSGDTPSLGPHTKRRREAEQRFNNVLIEICT